MDSITKRCTKCLHFKELSEFGKNNQAKDKKCFRCKECTKQYEVNRVRPKEHWEKKAAYERLRRYGLTQKQLDEMINKSNGQCSICNKEAKLLIDHCHKSNRVRELICHNCNTLLGHAKDSEFILASALEYLRRNTDEGRTE